MTNIIYFISGIGVGMLVSSLLMRTKKPVDGTYGVVEVNKARVDRKEKSKKKIFNLFKEKREISNSDVETLLKVSDATATRYLEELEHEGKIIQEGEQGRGVFYVLK